MAREILRNLEIDEISLVDRPAQTPAKIVLVKREFSSEQRERLADTGAALPDGSFDLVEGPKPIGAEDDSFSISQLVFQLRYRWQIAPLSDLFVVYRKGDRTRTDLSDFDDLFSDSWSDPLGEQFIIKLRYRLGS